MKASIQWIKELLPELKVSAAEIIDRLGSSGFEIESHHAVAQGLEHVVVGEVKTLVPHPDADSLRVAEVFDGTETKTVVCGAPNVEAGQKIALAKLGAKLPNGMTIERRKIRGVESEGMICSEAELGLSLDSDGIMVLKPKLKPGRAIVDALDLDDTLIEVSVTPNRPDVLSHFGLARELAALFGLPLPKRTIKLPEVKALASKAAKVEILDLARCPRYVARIVTGVKVGPSPSWVRRRLHAVGLRSISNVVDATNLALLELGHPLHAFDLERLAGPRIVVRTAEAGERLTTIDAQVRSLDPDDLVIADAERPVALAGVMGGADSGVSDGTTSLLLESALFDPKSIRRSAKRHALHSEASHRFERGADPEMLETAIDRCAELILELAGGEVSKGRVAVEGKLPDRPVVPIRPERATLVLGREVDKKEVKESLRALGLKFLAQPPRVKRARGEKAPDPKAEKARRERYLKALWFEVPSWRVDVKREEDLIEEVARLGGFGSIPTLMPPGSSAAWTKAPDVDPERTLRDLLAGEGFFDTVSLAFNARREVEALGIDPAGSVEVANPLGEESALMRRSMLPALLRAARHNQDMLPSMTDLRLFEIGKTFRWGDPSSEAGTSADAGPRGRLPVETHEVGFLLRGHRVPAIWAWKDSKGQVPFVDAFDVKAAVERVLAAFRVGAVEWLPHEAAWLHPRSGTRVEAGGRVLGYFGELHLDVMPKFGLEGTPVFVGHLFLEAILAVAGGHATFRPLPKLPPAQRDLSFFLGRDVPAAKVVGVIQKAAEGGALESVEVFDVYEGQGLPEGKRSLAVAMVFRALDRTLTDVEVERTQAAIVAAVTTELGAELRSA